MENPEGYCSVVGTVRISLLVQTTKPAPPRYGIGYFLWVWNIGKLADLPPTNFFFKMLLSLYRQAITQPSYRGFIVCYVIVCLFQVLVKKLNMLYNMSVINNFNCI